MRENMIVLGIDPGSHTTGYALLQASDIENLKYIRSGVLTARKRDPFLSRAETIFRQFYQLLEEVRPTVVVVEKIFAGVFPIASLQLAHMRGAFFSALWQMHIPWFEVSARAAKHCVTGYGGSCKEEVRFMIYKHFFLEKVLTQDEADALALVLCYMHNRRKQQYCDVGSPKPKDFSQKVVLTL